MAYCVNVCGAVSCLRILELLTTSLRHQPLGQRSFLQERILTKEAKTQLTEVFRVTELQEGVAPREGYRSGRRMIEQRRNAEVKKYFTGWAIQELHRSADDSG